MTPALALAITALVIAAAALVIALVACVRIVSTMTETTEATGELLDRLERDILETQEVAALIERRRKQ